MKSIVLASTSPRRREILSLTGLSFEVFDSEYKEDLSISPIASELTLNLAKGKAFASAQHFSESIIIAADQVITLNGEIFGKPHTPERQLAMLSKLSGKEHEVTTAYVVLDSRTGQLATNVVSSFITFRNLSDEEMHSYILTKEGIDRAGGYAIQGLGSILIKSIKGDYFNIVGLPLSHLVQTLLEFEIDVLKLRSQSSQLKEKIVNHH